MSPLLRLYLAFSRVSDLIWRIIHRKRLQKGKEIADRLPEKYGHYTRDRPAGTVLWFHALSIGESLALVPLIERALDELPDAHVLLTTSTASSVVALARANLPDRAIHVLQPIDTARAVSRFLDHWRPASATFAELDFWPRLMVETHARGIQMVLVNSRMTPSSFDSRSRLAGMTRDILRLFDRLLVQDAKSFDRFCKLGVEPDRISVVGALKAAARALPADQIELAKLSERIGNRPIWLAAATHVTEEPGIIAAHEKILQESPDALLIVAPRDLKGAADLESQARAKFEHVARRGDGQLPDGATQVYIADSFGEMGLWYRIAPISFIGHSLPPGADDLAGKNPYEAIALGSAVIHGPSVSYFSETYQELLSMGAAKEVKNTDALVATVLSLQDENARTPMIQAGTRVIEKKSVVLDKTWATIKARL